MQPENLRLILKYLNLWWCVVYCTINVWK